MKVPYSSLKEIETLMKMTKLFVVYICQVLGYCRKQMLYVQTKQYGVVTFVSTRNNIRNTYTSKNLVNPNGVHPVIIICTHRKNDRKRKTNPIIQLYSATGVLVSQMECK